MYRYKGSFLSLINIIVSYYLVILWFVNIGFMYLCMYISCWCHVYSLSPFGKGALYIKCSYYYYDYDLHGLPHICMRWCPHSQWFACLWSEFMGLFELQNQFKMLFLVWCRNKLIYVNITICAVSSVMCMTFFYLYY